MIGYSNNFYIEKAVSNNAFSFAERKNRRLFVPSIKEGGFEDLEEGNEIVFEDADENGKIKSCTGLKNFIKTEWNGIPVYIVDNHNHVFYFWHHAVITGQTAGGLPLIHIDQHKDSREPESYPAPANTRRPAALFTYANTVLNVGNFIPAALRTGVISRVINVTSQKEMDELKLPANKLILDMDMDFFAPEMDYIKPEIKIAFIKKLLPKASLITVATSPFFINQKSAINHLLKIFSCL